MISILLALMACDTVELPPVPNQITVGGDIDGADDTDGDGNGDTSELEEEPSAGAFVRTVSPYTCDPNGVATSFVYIPETRAVSAAHFRQVPDGDGYPVWNQEPLTGFRLGEMYEPTCTSGQTAGYVVYESYVPAE